MSLTQIFSTPTCHTHTLSLLLPPPPPSSLSFNPLRPSEREDGRWNSGNDGGRARAGVTGRLSLDVRISRKSHGKGGRGASAPSITKHDSSSSQNPSRQEVEVEVKAKSCQSPSPISNSGDTPFPVPRSSSGTPIHHHPLRTDGTPFPSLAAKTGPPAASSAKPATE